MRAYLNMRPSYDIEIKLTVTSLHDIERAHEITRELVRLRGPVRDLLQNDEELYEMIGHQLDVDVEAVEIPRELVCPTARTAHSQDQMEERELLAEHGRFCTNQI